MKKALRVVYIIIFCNFACYAANTVKLVDSIAEYPIAYQYIELLEDPTGNLTLQDIVGRPATDFKPNTVQLPRNYNRHSAYWIRFTIDNTQTLSDQWLFEYFDSSIQDIALYAPNSDTSYTIYRAGNLHPFYNKYVAHKNFVFPLFLPKKTKLTLYARIKSEHLIFMYGVIRSYKRFSFYALNEYYFLGLFYGIILAMAIYNLLLFLTTRDKTYLYYVFYVLSSGFLCMVLDGTGFQYLWPQNPNFNVHAFSFAMFSMVIWALMYTQGFVVLRKDSRMHLNILEIFIILRMLIFILAQTIFPDLNEVLFVDIFILFVCYASGLVSFNQGNRSTKYFVLGFTFLFVGFIISNLTVNSLLGFSLPNNIFTVYSFNLGIVLKMILLSYALAHRFKIIIREKSEAQNQLISELKEKDELKEKVNKELEQKVQERTSELAAQTTTLEEKNIELKTLYDEVTDNIKVAKWIQESILPPHALIQQHLPNNYIFYSPKDVVSGDFYWFENIGDKIYIAAVDCTGHGVAGAFMSIIGYNILNQIIRKKGSEKLNAAQILNQLNEGVIQTLRQRQKDAVSRDGMDINLCIFNLKEYKVNYAGAVNYLYIIRNGELIKLIADPFSIGIPKSGKVMPFTNHEFALMPGDMVIQYTDGYADQLGYLEKEVITKFKYPRFREMFLKIWELPAEEQFAIVKKNLEDWRQDIEQTDDILVIGTKII